VYTDFNSTHGLTFAGASGTTACANVTELGYGDAHGVADESQGSLQGVTREAGEVIATTNVRTSELGEHDRITPFQVRSLGRLSAALLSALVVRLDSFANAVPLDGTQVLMEPSRFPHPFMLTARYHHPWIGQL